MKLLQLLVPVCFCLNVWFLGDSLADGQYIKALGSGVGAVACIFGIYGLRSIDRSAEDGE